MGRDTEVSELRVPLMVQQNIPSLDVPMYFLSVMQVVEALQDRLANAGDLGLTQRLLCDLDNVCDRARITILEDEPQVIILHVAAIVLHDVGALAPFEDLNLLLQVFQVLTDREDLHGHYVSGLLVQSFEDLPEAALTQLL